jgi:hypothetical protein
MRVWSPIVVSLCFIAGGCTATRSNTGAPLSKFGPPDLFAKPIEDVDIIAALTNGKDSGQNLKGAAFSKKFDAELRQYPNTSRVERNRIQDRLILASNELCENYKVLLKKKQSRFNFYSGAAATLLGAAGGVATGAEGPQLLSALSGAASGVRAEYNGQYFSDLAAHVITKGIAARRKEILAAIEVGRAKAPADYTIEIAIADAIVYHGACSLVGGLEQADSTLSKFHNFVGLDALGANPAFIPAGKKGFPKAVKPGDAEAAPLEPAVPPAPEDSPQDGGETTAETEEKTEANPNGTPTTGN